MAVLEDFADTGPRVMEICLHLLRTRTAGEKILAVLQLSELPFACRSPAFAPNIPNNTPAEGVTHLCGFGHDGNSI